MSWQGFLERNYGLTPNGASEVDASYTLDLRASTPLKISGTAVTATAAELNILDGATGAVVLDSTTVDTSAGGTAQTTNCTLVPANSLLLGVRAVVVTAMDGDTTTTLEVGVSGNADAYIDTSDFDPSAAADTEAFSIGGTNNDVKEITYLASATQIIATWTNTASASAGDTTVQVIYVPLA